MKQQNKLKFYIVKEKYIKYLMEFDRHVSWNKEQKRPYLGVVLKIGKYLYFAPLYSYKKGYNKYKENPSFMRIKDRKGKNVSIIRFSEMIPVPESYIKLLDFDERGEKYKNLLQAEIDYINSHKSIVYSKAKKIYKNVALTQISFFMDISCNFKLLEEKLEAYKRL